MAELTVTGATGNAKVKNSRVAGIQCSGKGLPLQEDISKVEVTGVAGDAQVENSLVIGINEGQMGSIDADGNGQCQEVSYKMDSVPRGLCYIFSNKTFENDRNKTRIGVEKDRDALTKVWEKLHFVVKSFDDSKANVMEKRIEDLAKMDHKAYDCVVVIFLTHGRDGVVEGSDNEWLEVSTITSYFKASVCPSLANKPKLFFFQSCRGNEFQKAVPVQGDDGGSDAVASETIVEAVNMVAPKADFFFGFATVAGMVAHRNLETGSWFIQSLVQALEASTKRDDLDSIMTTVRRKVNDHQYEQLDGTFIRQTAEVQSTLQKKLYFTY